MDNAGFRGFGNCIVSLPACIVVYVMLLLLLVVFTPISYVELSMELMYLAKNAMPYDISPMNSERSIPAITYPTMLRPWSRLMRGWPSVF